MDFDKTDKNVLEESIRESLKGSPAENINDITFTPGSVNAAIESANPESAKALKDKVKAGMKVDFEGKELTPVLITPEEAIEEAGKESPKVEIEAT